METYKGHVRTPADAIILFEACRLGLLPRVQRRLSEKERQSITSGSVFVWDEREAGMRRWTDGKSWSASRVSGSFLTYREMEGKRGGNGFAAPLAATRAGKTPDSTRGSDSDLEMAGTGDDGHDGYRYKPDGLMKQSFSITTSSGNHLHLISYYARSHPNAGGLCNPSTDPQLRHIRPQKGMYPESTVQEQQNIPAVTRAPMVSAPYSTVPQMAGYARSGPPQQQMQYNMPNYNGWVPQPHWNTPNGNGPGYHGYGHHYGGHGPPMHHEHSPLSHSQSIEHPTSEPQPIQHPHSHPYARSPGPQYNRSPAPNENLVPQPQHHRTSSSGSHHQQYRSYPAERPPHSGPPHQQAHYAYEQLSSGAQPPSQYYSHHPSYAQSDHSPYPPPQHPHHYVPPQHYPPPQSYPHPQHSPQQQPHLSNRNHAQQQSGTPTMPQIDPRLMAPSSLSQQQHQRQRQLQNQSQRPLQYQSQRQPTSSSSPSPQVPASVLQDGASKPASQASPNANGTSQSQASTIPSIGSIMNGPPPTSNPNTASAKNGPPPTSNPNSASVMKGPLPPATPTSIENINAANVNANADATGERSGSTSPVANLNANGNTSVNAASANTNASANSKANATANTNTNPNANANGTANGNTAQEIPKEKLGFKEDVRALRVLDRAFRT